MDGVVPGFAVRSQTRHCPGENEEARVQIRGIWGLGPATPSIEPCFKPRAMRPAPLGP